MNIPPGSTQLCILFCLKYLGVVSCISNDSLSLSPDPIRFRSRSRLPTFGSACKTPLLTDVFGICSSMQFFIKKEKQL